VRAFWLWARNGNGARIAAFDKATTTRAPGTGRSDAVLVALLTFGAGLLLAATLRARIQEFAIGGVSIKLTEAAVASPGIALVDMEAPYVSSVDSTPINEIAKEADAIARRGVGLVRVDLRGGDLWAPLKFSVFVLLLAHRANAEVMVFSGDGKAGRDTFIGAASIARLANRLAADDPTLAAAYRGNRSDCAHPSTIRPSGSTIQS
jgi:hypothetical protein